MPKCMQTLITYFFALVQTLVVEPQMSNGHVCSLTHPCACECHGTAPGGYEPYIFILRLGWPTVHSNIQSA